MVYLQSTHNSQTIYTAYNGVSEADAITTLTDLGHTSVSAITEATYLANQSI